MVVGVGWYGGGTYTLLEGTTLSISEDVASIANDIKSNINLMKPLIALYTLNPTSDKHQG